MQNMTLSYYKKLNCELDISSKVSNDFDGNGVSAIDTENGILKCRPTEGLAMLENSSIIYSDARTMPIEIRYGDKNYFL